MREKAQLRDVGLRAGIGRDEVGGLVERRCADGHREGEGRVTGRKLKAEQAPKREVNRHRHENRNPEENRNDEEVGGLDDREVARQRKGCRSRHDCDRGLGGVRDFGMKDQAVDHHGKHHGVAGHADREKNGRQTMKFGHARERDVRHDDSHGRDEP